MTPKPESIEELFHAVKAKFPTSLEPERWYLVAASALVSCSDPSSLGKLYIYLTQQPDYASAGRRRYLNKRLREFVMKQWVTIGVPKAATALFGLIKEEKPGDADLTFTKFVPPKVLSTRQEAAQIAVLDSAWRPVPLQAEKNYSKFYRSHVHLDATTRDKGSAFLDMLYGPERAATLFTTWGADFEWLTKDVVYGMFYADDSVLDALETELITYMAIACQGLETTVRNHLGGLLRMGLSVEEVEGVTECGLLVARWAECDTTSWPDVRAVVASLG